MEQIQLPSINTTVKQSPQQQTQHIQITKLPSLIKSSTAISFNSKSNSARSSENSRALLTSSKPNHDLISLSSSDSSLSSSEDQDSASQLPNKKNSRIKKYYYLQPLYVHPDRRDLSKPDHRKKHVEIPPSLSFKFMGYITNEKWKEALKLCKKGKALNQ